LPAPDDFLQLAERRGSRLDASDYSLEVISRTRIVVVPEAKPGCKGVSFDRLERLVNEASQHARALGENVLLGFGRAVCPNTLRLGSRVTGHGMRSREMLLPGGRP
jgi:hypothetical protein